MNYIELKNFNKKYGEKKIFSNFNLKINKGEMIAITGESGSGKTVLLNTIGLIESIESGELFLFNSKAPRVNTQKSNKIIRDKISYLFQNFALIEHKTVEDNLLMALKYTNLKKQEKIILSMEALEEVGLKGLQKCYIYELSGGEQQRVSLARSIIKPNELIMADEPTGSLDKKNRNSILKLLKKVNSFGKTIIIVTHDPVVAKYCDRIIEL